MRSSHCHPLPRFFFSPSAFLVLPLFDSVWFGNCQSILQSMMDVRISHPESHPSASSPFPSLPYVRALNASRRGGRKGRAGEGAQVTVTTDGGPLRRHRCWQGMECIIILLSDTRKHAEATEARADIRAAREGERPHFPTTATADVAYPAECGDKMKSEV